MGKSSGTIEWSGPSETFWGLVASIRPSVAHFCKTRFSYWIGDKWVRGLSEKWVRGLSGKVSSSAGKRV